MAEVASAYVTLLPSAKGFAQGIQGQVGGDLKRAGTQGGKDYGTGMKSGVAGMASKIFAPLAIAAAGLGLGKILTSSISAGSNFEQALGGADAVFKKEAAGIKASADAAAGALGLPKTAYLELATVVGAGLKNKGVKDFAGETEKLITIGGDLAAQFGGSTKDAVDAIASAMRGESDPIERYGVALNETAVNAKALELGLEKVDGKFTEQQKTTARLALITQQTADAQGAFARESDTLAGKQARLAATWENIKTKVGTALLPVLTRFSGWILDKGLPALEKLGGGIKGVGEILFKGNFTAGLREAFGWEEDSKAVDFLFRVREGFLRVKDTAKGLFDLFASGDITGALTKGLGVEEDSKVIGFLLGVRDGAIEAWDRLKQFGSFLKNDLWPALKEAYNVIAPALKKAFSDIAGSFGPGDGTSTDWVKFGDILTQKVIPFIAKMVEVYLPLWAQHIKTVIAAVKLAWQAFETWRDIMATVVSFILGKLISVSEGFQTMLETLGKVPGFGWAKEAAAAMQGPIDKAKGIKEAIDRIPSSKTVSISVNERFRSTGSSRFNNDGVGYAPGRATGGPVKAGQPYMVGEKGPELIVPRYHGNVIPNHDLGSGTAAASAASRFDYARMGDDLVHAMRQATFAVEPRAVTRVVNQRNGDRGRY